MSRRLRQVVSWITLAQVALVGGLGMGLHGLLGCEHGQTGCCEQGLCLATCCSTASEAHDCVFCRHHESTQRDRQSSDHETGDRLTTVDGLASCDGCAVCDLLDQYHNATPIQLDSLTLELTAEEAAIQLHNAVVSAATRLALSRGPPTA